MITCRICKCNKPFTNFSKRPNSKTGYRTECKPCLYVQRKKQPNFGRWHKENKKRLSQYNRERTLKRYHNITIEDYNNMLEAQHGACAICKTYAFMGIGKKAHVDHCHKTGKIRGLLCNLCNVGLGAFRDSPEVMMLAANYLVNNGAEIVDTIEPLDDWDYELK